jgi:hypothetical protein
MVAGPSALSCRLDPCENGFMTKEDAVRVAEFQVLSEPECRDWLAEGSVGRVAFLDGEFPVVLPVNYVVDDDLILIRSAHDRHQRDLRSTHHRAHGYLPRSRGVMR